MEVSDSPDELYRHGARTARAKSLIHALGRGVSYARAQGVEGEADVGATWSLTVNESRSFTICFTLCLVWPALRNVEAACGLRGF